MDEIASLTLYHFPGSRSARVRWALAETYGQGYTLRTMDLLKGEAYAPEFLQFNPNHSVPVLQVQWQNGELQYMLESVAMIEWLADAYPDKGLAPAPALTQQRADYLQMIHFAGDWMDAMLWQLRLHRNLLPEGEVDQRTIDRTQSKFTAEVEPQLWQRLSQADYICGSAFSAADIVMGHNVNWARAYGMCKDGVFSDYVSRLQQRAAYVHAFDDVSR
ncbi:MAG: glutathione S-transferase family protein [Pseudomonadota bacterium]